MTGVAPAYYGTFPSPIPPGHIVNSLASSVAISASRIQRPRFLRDVLRGLTRRPKRLPSKYFYDAEGSRLFDQICQLPEYYPTRTELQIMEGSVGEMASVIGSGSVLIEYGSGSSVKTRLLLDTLSQPRAYLPVDISHEHLHQSAASLNREYPGLCVRPITADFTRDFELPAEVIAGARPTVYFPGSTIGNFTQRQALKLLGRIRRQCSDSGGLLLGVDLIKDRDVLRRAYNDAAGVTAAFNLNLLRRINRELGGQFDLQSFEHVAIWNERRKRIEMHLRSRCDHTAAVRSRKFHFRRGETICTEFSHKYTCEQLEQMAARCGFTLTHVWTDPQEWFGVAYLRSE
jgi:dimethylhistidine N-methyltransferase